MFWKDDMKSNVYPVLYIRSNQTASGIIKCHFKKSNQESVQDVSSHDREQRMRTIYINQDEMQIRHFRVLQIASHSKFLYHRKYHNW